MVGEGQCGVELDKCVCNVQDKVWKIMTMMLIYKYEQNEMDREKVKENNMGKARMWNKQILQQCETETRKKYM